MVKWRCIVLSLSRKYVLCMVAFWVVASFLVLFSCSFYAIMAVILSPLLSFIAVEFVDLIVRAIRNER